MHDGRFSFAGRRSRWVSKRIGFVLWLLAAGTLLSTDGSWSAARAQQNWPMRQRDMAHTGRADYVVPPERLDSSFFDIFLWQKPAPGSPQEGGFGAATMVFYDGAGPGGADLVVGAYHWPKGVQGMDRHDGRLYWTGNPGGGETIATRSPAFSNDGSALYVINDATESGEYPEGHPLMAFSAAEGPAVFRHNGAMEHAWHFTEGSPTIDPAGRVFMHQWDHDVYAAWDDGQALSEVWASQTSLDCGLSGPSLYEEAGQLRVVIGAGGYAEVVALDGTTGEALWRTPVDGPVDATPTIDPADGRIYATAQRDGDVFVVGLDKDGQALWGSPSLLVYDYQEGMNNPQTSVSCGCLSHDGATYYFQTESEQADGSLYAVRTADGTVKWSVMTGSAGWFDYYSSPVVTPNGVIIVGNNDGNAYYAILDEGTQGRVLDTLVLAPPVNWAQGARSSATIAADGALYLPLRTWWLRGNGDGDIPSGEIENLYCAIDLTPDAQAYLPAPPWQEVQALNGAALVTWEPINDPGGALDHYALYRDTAPFHDVSGMTPIALIDAGAPAEHVDPTATNGTSYWYAVTSITTDGVESDHVNAVGPRTPYDETDVQIVSIARTPRYPRYDAQYSDYEVTEPSGFGPYWFSAATGLGSGQDADTQRWPRPADPVTYTATIRNRGTNPISASPGYSWTLDGAPAGGGSFPLHLSPGESVTVSWIRPWDDTVHEIGFSLALPDDRPENNSLAVGTKSVGFLTYVDRSRLEEFREETPGYPGAVTDDLIDWLNLHMERFNALFAEAGSAKRVHYEILEPLHDSAPDPTLDRLPFAIFPFRYYVGEPSVRTSGYYEPAEDIDYGLLHEMGHQLGLIDIYQLNLDPNQNLIDGTGYAGPECLMNGCSHFLSEHSARAMDHWIDTAHGYFGQYQYCLPGQMLLRLLGVDGAPLAGAVVRAYQMVDRPGIGKVISGQVKFEAVAGQDGIVTLPNVAIDTTMVPTTFAGDRLRDSPFGYVAVVGNNGLFLFEVTHDGCSDYAWLDITEANNAYWAGQTETAVFERRLALGGEIEYQPPADMAENNAERWACWAAQGAITLADDPEIKVAGAASVRAECTGGFDNYFRYPGDRIARWDLREVQRLHAWFYAENDNGGFQDRAPWFRLRCPGGSVDLKPRWDILNDAIGQWVEFVIPLEGVEIWERIVRGEPDLSRVQSLDIHADTWGYGFTLWIDGVYFDPQPSSTVGEPAAPALLALGRAAPNPFIGSTRLRLDLPRPGPVSLAVFDVAGRRVRTLAEGPMPAGVREMVFDGRDSSGRLLAPGVYLLRLSAERRTIERKVVIAR